MQYVKNNATKHRQSLEPRPTASSRFIISVVAMSDQMKFPAELPANSNGKACAGGCFAVAHAGTAM
jgi:hypothetical protein